MYIRKSKIRLFKRTGAIVSFLVIWFSFSSITFFYKNTFSPPNSKEYNGGLIDDIRLIRCYKWYSNCSSLFAPSLRHGSKIVEWSRVSKNISDENFYSFRTTWLYNEFIYVHYFNPDKTHLVKPLADIAISRDAAYPPLVVIKELKMYNSDGEDSWKNLLFSKNQYKKQHLHNVWYQNDEYFWSKEQWDNCLVTDIEIFIGFNFIESRPYWKEVTHELERDNKKLPISITRKVTCNFASTYVVSPDENFVTLPLNYLQKQDSFKILQVSDLLLKGHSNNENMLGELQTRIFISGMIAVEHPDLIVITGGFLDGQYTKDYQTCILSMLQPIIKAKIPFVISFGDKDYSNYASIKQIRNFISQLPFCLNKYSDTDNHISIPVKLPSSDSDNTSTDLSIFVFDSKTSKRDFIKKYKSDFPKLPKLALAFQYFPIPEYRYSGIFPIIGQYNEKNKIPDSYDYDDTLLENLYTLNIKALSCGYDSNNDCCLQSKHDIWLCYSGSASLTSPATVFMPPSVRLFKIDGTQNIITSWKRNYKQMQEVYDYQYIFNSDQ